MHFLRPSLPRKYFFGWSSYPGEEGFTRKSYFSIVRTQNLILCNRQNSPSRCSEMRNEKPLGRPFTVSAIYLLGGKTSENISMAFILFTQRVKRQLISQFLSWIKCVFMRTDVSICSMERCACSEFQATALKMCMIFYVTSAAAASWWLLLKFVTFRC